MSAKNKIALPHAARSLCVEAIQISNKLAEGKDHAEMMKARCAINNLVNHLGALGKKDFNLPDYDQFNLFNVPADMEKLKETLKEFGLQPDLQSKSTGLLGELEDTDENLETAIYLVILVNSIKEIEDEFLKSKKRISYKDRMEKLDRAIWTLSNVIMFAKTLEPAKELFTTKFQRKSGAKKGGLKKKEKFEDLKNMVLEEASANHGDKTGAKAARSIFEKLGHESPWLKDDKGKPVSQDPVTLFTRWINAERSTDKS